MLMVCPAEGMTASLVGPGRAGLLDQLAACSQVKLSPPPVQMTVWAVAAEDSSMSQSPAAAHRAERVQDRMMSPPNQAAAFPADCRGRAGECPLETVYTTARRVARAS